MYQMNLRNKPIYITLLFLLAYTCIFSQKQVGLKPSNSDFEKDYAKGISAYKRGEYKEAKDYFDVCLLQFPKHPKRKLAREFSQKALNLLEETEIVKIHLSNGDKSSARKSIYQILRENPTDLISQNNLKKAEESIALPTPSTIIQPSVAEVKKPKEKDALKESKDNKTDKTVKSTTGNPEKPKDVAITPPKIIIPDCKPQFDELVKLANQQYGKSQFKNSVKNYNQAKKLHCSPNTKWIDDAIFYCNRSIELLMYIDQVEDYNDENSIKNVLIAYQKLTQKYAPHSQEIKKQYYAYCKRRFLRNPCGSNSKIYSLRMESLDDKLYEFNKIKAILDNCVKEVKKDSVYKKSKLIDCSEQFRQLELMKEEIKEASLNIEGGNYSLAEKRLIYVEKKIKSLGCKSVKDSIELPKKISTLLSVISIKNKQKKCIEKSRKYLFQSDSLFTNGRCKSSFDTLNKIEIGCLSKMDSVVFSTLYTRVRCCINDTLFIQHMKSNQDKYLDSTRLSYEIRERTDVCFYIREAVKFTCTKEDSLKLENQYRDCRCKNFRENCPEKKNPTINIKQISCSDTATKSRVKLEFFVGGSLGTFLPTYPLAVLADDGYNVSFDLVKRLGLRVSLMSYKKILDVRIGINSESFYYTVKDSKLTFPITTSAMSVISGNLDFKFHTLPSCPSKIRYYFAPGIVVSRYGTDAPKIPFLEDYTNRTFNDKTYGGLSLTLGLEKTKSSGKTGYSIELFYKQLGTLYSKQNDAFLKPWDSSTAQMNFIGLNLGVFIF